MAEWADKAGLPLAVTNAVLSHEVTGNLLFHLDDWILEEEFGLASSVDRKSVLDAVAKRIATSSGEQSLKLTFYEYRSMNRKESYRIVNLLTLAPRVATWLMANNSRLPAHALPAEQIGWLAWIFMPEKFIYENHEGILGGVPGFMPGLLLFHRLWRTVLMLLQPTDLLGEILFEVVVGVAIHIIFFLVFPFMPWVFVDLQFWMLAYALPPAQCLNCLLSLHEVIGHVLFYHSTIRAAYGTNERPLPDAPRVPWWRPRRRMLVDHLLVDRPVGPGSRRGVLLDLVNQWAFRQVYRNNYGDEAPPELPEDRAAEVMFEHVFLGRALPRNTQIAVPVGDGRTFLCGICQENEDVSMAFTIPECRHRYCSLCLTSYVTSQINDGPDPHPFTNPRPPSPTRAISLGPTPTPVPTLF